MGGEGKGRGEEGREKKNHCKLKTPPPCPLPAKWASEIIFHGLVTTPPFPDNPPLSHPLETKIYYSPVIL